MGKVIQNITNHKRLFIDLDGNQYDSIKDLRAGRKRHMNKEEKVAELKKQLEELENEK